MATDSTLLSAGHINADADHGAADNDMDFGSVQLAAAKPEGTVPVQLPQGQQVVVIPVSPGQTIELPTDSPDGLLAKIGADGNLAIVVDGRTIILQGFVAANDAQPITIVTNDGDIVDITDVIASTLPDVALDIQTAAGPAAGAQAGTTGPDASGSGIFVPFAAGPLLGGFQAAGVLGATQLAYKNIDDEQRFFVKEEESNDLPKTIVIIPEEGQPVAEDGAFLVDEDFLKDGNHDLPAPSPQDDAGSASAAGFVVVDFGLDGPRALDPILMDPIVGGNGTPSGLFTTNGTPILLHLDAAAGGQQVLHGYLTNPGVDDAFVLILDTTTGQFQLVLNESLQHDENSFEDNVALDVVFSAFDANNDQQSATLHLSFDDDMPEITAGEGQFKLALDETTTTHFINTDYNDPNFPDDGVQDGSAPENTILGKLPAALNNYGAILGASQADASVLFNVQFGADNEALNDSEVFEFTILSANTQLKDTETGEFITLVDKGNGLIEGQISGGVVVFALTIDSNGFVSMAQYRALDHGDEEAAPGAHDEVVALGAGILGISVTATDGDGDQATKTIDVGDDITFDDDGPTWTVITVNNSTLNEDGLTGGVVGGPGDFGGTNLITTAQYNFNLGNDKNGSLSIADLTVRDGKGNVVALADLRTADGHEIVIDKSVDAGTGVITWVGVIQDGPNAGDPAFTITLDGAGANMGAFTFELQAPLQHSFTDPDSNNDGPETAYEDDIRFTFTVRGTDGDGDSVDTPPISIYINDDSPTIKLNDAAISLAVDETVSGNGTDVDDPAYPFPPQDGTTIENDEDLVALPQVLKDYGDVIGAATADASKLFTVQFGADGGAATDPESFSLKILNPNTGLTDTASGDPIILVNNNGVIEGRADDGDANTVDPVVFALTVDQDGNISMAQYRAINHGAEEQNESGEDGAFDEVLYLGTGKLAVEVSATDADGDKTTLSSDLGNAISFDDDGPNAVDDTDSVDEETLFATGNVITGADGGLGTDENGEDGVADDVGSDGFKSISWQNEVGGAIDTTYGKLFVDADGNYKYELDADSQAVKDLGEGETKEEIFHYTITDGDGDESSATLTITITGKNDGPHIDLFPEDPNTDDRTAVVSDEGLPPSNPDTTGQPTDDTNLKTFVGNLTVSDPDVGDTLTVAMLNTGTFPAWTFGGNLVSWSLSGDGLTLTGTAGGNTALTVVITPNGVNQYIYTVTQFQALDHPETDDPNAPGVQTSFEDELAFNITVQVKDSSNATDTAILTIQVEDDSPVVESSVCGAFLLQVDETVNGAGAPDVDANGASAQDGTAAEGDEFLNAAAVTAAGLGALGTVIGAATSSAAGLFSGTPGADGEKSHSYDLQILNGGLTALVDTATGSLIQLIEEGGFIKGVVQGTGELVFALSINEQTGAVTMAQYRAINHGTDAPVSYPDEVLALGTGVLQVTYSITDKDNDTASFSKDIGDAITFDDDGPAAVNDTDSVTEDTATVATGNVVTGLDGQNVGFGSDANGTDGNKDAAGSDGFGSISWKGAISDVVDTTYGKLIVDADGNYRYELDNSSTAVQQLKEGETKQEVFTYTILDKDGDASTAELTITITGKNDGPTIDFFPNDPNVKNGATVVSDEGLAGSNPDSNPVPADETNSKTAGGTFKVSDVDAGDVLTVALLTSGLPALTFGGQLVDWSVDPDGHTLRGKTGGTDAITVEISTADGFNYNYAVTLIKALDHPDDTIEDELDFNVTLKVTDLLGASDTALLNIEIEDDSPVVNPGTCGTFLLAVDETVGGGVDVDANGTNGTAQDGSAAEGDEILNAAAVVTAGLNALGTAIGAATSSTSALFSGTAGADGEKSHLYDLQILNGGLTALRDTATGGLIQLIEEGGFIKGVVQGTGELVFAIHINDQTGLVTMAQYRAINHGTDAPVSFPDEVLALGSGLLQVTYSITDKDNDVGSLSKDLGGSITFDDDGPVNYDPQNQKLLNFPGGSISGDLDIGGHTGSDGFGSVVFSGFANGDVAKDTGGNTLTSGGQTIELNGVGTTTLTGYVDANNNNIVDAGETVFTATLDPTTDSYQFTLVKDIDDGTSVTTLSFDDIHGGQEQWFFFDANEGAGNDQDVLVTSRVQLNQSANTSKNDIGNANQWVDSDNGGEGLRIDFATNVAGTPNEATGLNSENGFIFTDHYLVNDAGFTVSQTQGGGTTGIKVRLSDTINNAKTGAGTYADFLAQNNIAMSLIVVKLGAITLVEGTDYFVSGPDVDGYMTITGLDDGYTLTFTGASDYDRIEVDYASGVPFAINNIFYEEATAGNPLDVQFQTTLTDGDGDTSTGAIDINLQPADASDDTFTGHVGKDTLFGGGGNDTLSGNDGDDTLNGGDGKDTLNGGNGNDTINGGNGDDTINGGAGNDTVTGGQGVDTIDVSQGDDTVRITTGLDGNDVINGFDADPTGGQDHVDLDALFDALGVAAGARAGRVQVSDGGADALVTIDLTGNGFGAGDIQIKLVGIADHTTITVGAAATNDILTGS